MTWWCVLVGHRWTNWSHIAGDPTGIERRHCTHCGKKDYR